MDIESINLDSKPKFGKAEVLLICCIVFQLIMYLLPIRYGDGYFCDELYQIAMSNHISWGGVDVPPLTPFLLAVVRHLFGMSLYALRLLPAISGIAIIYLIYLMVKKLEGNFTAYLIALICITLEPGHILTSSLYTYDYMNRLIWAIMLYIILLLIKTDNKKYWIYFGIFAGLGMMTKWSFLFLGAGIFGALILTERRKDLISPQIWIGGILALLIFLPYIIWNFCNGFPTFEFMAGWSSHHDSDGSLIKYFSQIILLTNLLSLPIWILGVYYFLFNSQGKKYRLLGISLLIILVLVLYARPKFYLITAYFPVLFAGGSVLIGRYTEKHRLKWTIKIYVFLLILSGILLVPLVRPILPAKTLAKYYGIFISGKYVHYQGSTQLPQWFSDRFGWENLTEKVAEVYNSLPPNEKNDTAIFAAGYSEAGAISFFGKKYGLPEAISGHNNFYLWGPKNYSGKTMIIIENNSLEHYKQIFAYVKYEGQVSSEYGRRSFKIWLCRKPKFGSLKEFWPSVKHFD